MLLRRFYDSKLAAASYLLGCTETGEALVVDPGRDAEQYAQAAAQEHLRITAVTETHIHADFVSGSRELAARTGARLLLSGEGGTDWHYRFARGDGATLLRDHDRFSVGRIQVEVLHTPGHTPEHLSFMVTDTAATGQPMGVFTGDFIFVGDVGRPDLLERAAHHVGTMEAGARQLFGAIGRFLELPDYLQLWPGHGAGSACGKALGAVPQTTLGYERLVNWGLTTRNEAAFVREVLSGQPDPPRYFAEMKRINRDGPRLLGGFRRPPGHPAGELPALLERGALVVDIRPAAEFAAEHVPGTLNIPLNRSFTTWAGWLLPYDREIHLLTAGPGRHLDEAVRDLAMIGLDRVAGWFGADAIEEWIAEGHPVQTIPQVTPDALAGMLAAGEATAVDVRAASEWSAGHLPGVANIPLGDLSDRLDTLPAGRPIVLHCQGGGRSSIAASLLQSRGIADVVNLVGGYGAWRDAGLPVEHGETVAVE